MFDPKIKILIVDDMMTMRKLVKKCLTELGFSDITEAKDGADAWEKLSTTHATTQLIVSDWNMPNLAGIDLLRKVRADARFSKLPFVMVTAESEQTQMAEAIKAGVSQYVIKPFTTQDLRAKLESTYKRLNTQK